MKTKRIIMLSTFRLLWKGNWFVQEKSCKILAMIVRYLMHCLSKQWSVTISRNLNHFFFSIDFEESTCDKLQSVNVISVQGLKSRMVLFLMENPQAQRRNLLPLMMCWKDWWNGFVHRFVHSLAFYVALHVVCYIQA